MSHPSFHNSYFFVFARGVHTPYYLCLPNTRGVRYGVALQDALAADTGRDYMRILLSIVNGNKDSLKDVDSHK
jgi:hypothetical protein